MIGALRVKVQVISSLWNAAECGQRHWMFHLMESCTVWSKTTVVPPNGILTVCSKILFSVVEDYSCFTLYESAFQCGRRRLDVLSAQRAPSYWDILSY